MLKYMADTNMVNLKIDASFEGECKDCTWNILFLNGE